MTADVDGAEEPLTRLPDPRERPWLKVAEVAGITGEGEKAIRAAISAGDLPSISVGRYVRIPTAALFSLVGLPATPDEDGHDQAAGGAVRSAHSRPYRIVDPDRGPPAA